MLSLAGWNWVVKNYGLAPHSFMMFLMLGLTLAVNVLLAKRKGSFISGKLEFLLSLTFVGAGQFAAKRLKWGIIF